MATAQSSPTSFLSSFSSSSSSQSFSLQPHSVFNISNIKNHVSIVLDFTNFLLWQTLFTNILHCYQIYDHIDETSQCPSPTISIDNDDSSSTQINPAYTLWVQIGHLIVSWLHATISPEILKHVIQPSKQFSARQTWLEIQKLFQDHVNAKPVDDDDVILQILSELPLEYSDVVTVMTARKPLPIFLELGSFLLAHESRLQQGTAVHSTNAQAMLATRRRGSYQPRSYRGNYQRGGRQSYSRGYTSNHQQPRSFGYNQCGSYYGNYQSRPQGGPRPWSSSVLGAPPPATRCQICDDFFSFCQVLSTTEFSIFGCFTGLRGFASF
ncbi:unnamed protein product [Fraxinus pennsylvanica]|uniref:Uncharacterized protein n=1 Tax=Fraxinus pennsylvanica TaxID=56036 RepID=A0AAD2E6F9_9LAMI|nr:unnamed protein product [Fraxinus pennsylvanica]